MKYTSFLLTKIPVKTKKKQTSSLNYAKDKWFRILIIKNGVSQNIWTCLQFVWFINCKFKATVNLTPIKHILESKGSVKKFEGEIFDFYALSIRPNLRTGSKLNTCLNTGIWSTRYFHLTRNGKRKLRIFYMRKGKTSCDKDTLGCYETLISWQ